MQYDFSLSPYQARQYEVFGRFVKYVQGAGPIRVTLSAGGYVDLMPGQGVFGIEFQNFVVEDRAGIDNRGVIMAGSFDFRDDRITGTVDMVDGGYNRTMANQAFSGALFQSGVAGQWSHGMLFNPETSKNSVIVSSYDLATNAAATALVGIVEGSGQVGARGASKLAGGEKSRALLQPFAQAALSPPPTNSKVLYLSANTQFVGTLKEPIVLMPGYGMLICMNSAQGLPLTANFEYTEVPLLV